MTGAIDLDYVAQCISVQHGIPAVVEHTGGGVATLYVDGPRRRIAVGPGWFHGTRTFADPSDLSMGPEDGDPEPVSLADVADDVDLTGRIVDYWVAQAPPIGTCAACGRPRSWGHTCPEFLAAAMAETHRTSGADWWPPLSS